MPQPRLRRTVYAHPGFNGDWLNPGVIGPSPHDDSLLEEERTTRPVRARFAEHFARRAERFKRPDPTALAPALDRPKTEASK